MRRPSNLLTGLILLALAGLAIAPSVASARLRFVGPLPGPRVLLFGAYSFTCDGVVRPWVVRPGSGLPPCPGPADCPMPLFIFQAPAAPNQYFSGLIPSPCDGSFAVANASFPAGGAPWALGRIIGSGGAGLVGGQGDAVATPADTLTDSLAVTVTNRNTVANTITISINGLARHVNPGAGNSRLKVVVYADSTSAKNETGGGVATGQMTFIGSAKKEVSGFFNAGDFTEPTQIGNAFQISTIGTLSKIISVPNATTATLSVEVDPDASTATLAPASTPLALLLLASVLLGGAMWFLVSRRRPGLA